jgi:hypothetical protein
LQKRESKKVEFALIASSGYYPESYFYQGAPMQIVVSILGGILIVYLFFNGLAELGIGTAGLNPILRYRRRKWKERSRNPLYNIDSPMEMTALLMVAAAKDATGLNTESKHEILRLFESEFRLSGKHASELLIASEYLLGDGSELRDHLKEIMKKSLRNFTREQAASALSMIEYIARLDKTGNPATTKLLTNIKKLLNT